MKTLTLTLAALSIALVPVQQASAHCQVPCGIFHDSNVFQDLKEDHETIVKAMKQISELSKDMNKNAHQVTRWVVNKESHAQSIQDTIGSYFLAQRVKPNAADKDAYLKKLETLHHIIFYAMKCKHGTDTANADKLLEAIEAFEKLYNKK